MKRTLFLKTLALIVGLMLQVTMSWGQLLVEDFDYPIGSLLTNNGWTAHSGSGSQPIDVTTGLNFTGYIGSGIGGAANLDNTGEDDNKTFSPQTTGTVYCAFIIQTQSTNSAGYFIHFGQQTIGTTFFTRVWVNATGNGVGIGTNAPTTYIPITAGVPTFLVMKYDIASKVSSLYVFNTFPTAEPATANATFTEIGGYANVGAIALRQYNASQRIIVDGIRIATNWADAATSGTITTVATPTFSPTPGVTENPIDVTISCSTPNSNIYYTLDGSDPDQNSNHYTIPFNVSQTTTVKARAYADGLEPSGIAAGIYTFRTLVSTIAELRAGSPGIPYKLTGEAYLTYQQAWRNQKYIQDNTGAILIDDFGGKITSAYEIGDGITGLRGSLTLYVDGMLEFVPAFDPGDPTGFHLFTPQVITINDLNTNFENYEAELVRIENVTFEAGGTTFASGTSTVYNISDVSSDAAGYFRTTFLDADYLGTTIPAVPTAIIGICNSASFSSTIINCITSRTSSDIIPTVLTPTIFVTSPDGGEFWQRGTTETIKWNNSNFTGNVTIQLSEPEELPLTLVANIANTGQWDWAIPANLGLGNQYKIIVNGTAPGGPSDESNGYFTIVPYYGLPQIVINEIQYNPSNANPALSDTYYEYFELYNKGSYTANLDGWTVSQALVHTFAAGTSIAPGGYLVLAINADSVMNFYGISNVIKWNSGNLNNTGEPIVLKMSDGVLIDSVYYSASAPWPSGPAGGSGQSLELIDPSYDNTLPANWLASIAPQGTPGLQNSVYGYQGLTVTSPNGGESWEQGSTHAITWTSINFTDKIKIELETVAKGFITLAENVPAADGTWNWTIQVNQAIGTNYKIKISDQVDGNPMDQSNATFSIIAMPVPVLTVTSPNGGEQWVQGSTQPITWTSANFTGNIKIELETVAKGFITLAENVAVATGTWSWAIPADQAVGSNYKIKISDQADGDPMDESNATFSITAVPVASLTVTSPNGGEQWMQGTTHAITWTSANFTGTIKIELETAAKGLVTLAENIAVTAGTWSWAIPANQAAGTNYKIRISDQADGDPMDQSDATFTITATPSLPKIVITEIFYNGPEGGTDSTEFIELYNNDVVSVNLQGWSFTGVDYIFPNVDLAPGAYHVSCLKSSTMLNVFGVTAAQWTGGALSNSGELIALKNAASEIIDSLTYRTSAPWPTAANGNGPSLVLCDPSSDNSVAANWSPCIEYVKKNTAGAAIYASPGVGCTGDLAQTMTVPTGWNGISTYMEPTTPAIETLFVPISNAVTVLQNFSSIYLPAYSINTIGNWDPKIGYQSNLTAAKYFVIKGSYQTNKTVNLNTGWNGLPVISTCAVNVATLFAGVPEFIFIKEMGSDLVYWPEGGISTLVSLTPGKAYYIKVSAPVSITFPECAAKGDETPELPVNTISSIWNTVIPTGASHAIGFARSALADFQIGDVIGVFTANGLCAGITEIGEGNTLLMAWADDIYTLESDGFTEAETFSYKVYRPSTKQLYEVSAVYDNNAPDAGNFATNGISMVKELKMGAAGIGAPASSNIRIYPNPASSVVTVDFAQAFTSVEVYSMVGSLLYTGTISGSLLKLDVSNFERGVYFLKLINQTTGDQTTTRFIKE